MRNDDRDILLKYRSQFSISCKNCAVCWTFIVCWTTKRYDKPQKLATKSFISSRFMHTSKLVLVFSQGSWESDFFYHKFSIIDFFSIISLLFFPSYDLHIKWYNQNKLILSLAIIKLFFFFLLKQFWIGFLICFKHFIFLFLSCIFSRISVSLNILQRSTSHSLFVPPFWMFCSCSKYLFI